MYLQGRISGDQLVNNLSSSLLGDLTTNNLDTEQDSSISLGELPSAITYRYSVYMQLVLYKQSRVYIHRELVLRFDLYLKTFNLSKLKRSISIL